MVKMSPFAVLLSLFAVLSVAYADVSHLKGYQYPKQSYNLGTGSLQLYSPTAQYATPYPSGQVNLLTSYAPLPSGSPFDSSSPLINSQSTLALSPPSAVSYDTQGSLLNANHQTQASIQGYQQPSLQVQLQQPVQYQQAPLQYYQPASYRTVAQTAPHYNSIKSPQEPIVTKHFYVHSAPDEPEQETGPRFVEVGRSQKTYKIIFIKAPTYSLKNQIVPIFPQNQEKTVVYVLSKKPEFDQTVQLPQPPPTEPSKPEVFFVKYKTQEEADRAQKEIQDAYNHASGDESAIDLRGVFSNAESTGSTSTLGGQEFAQKSQYAGVHYLSPEAEHRDV